MSEARTDRVDGEEAEPSTVAIYVVVLSRVLYSAVVTIALTYAIGGVLLGWGLPGVPLTAADVRWVGLFAVLAFAVIGLGFWLWVVLSWGTAYVLCPSVRDLDVDLDGEEP